MRGMQARTGCTIRGDRARICQARRMAAARCARQALDERFLQRRARGEKGRRPEEVSTNEMSQKVQGMRWLLAWAREGELFRLHRGTDGAWSAGGLLHPGVPGRLRFR